MYTLGFIGTGNMGGALAAAAAKATAPAGILLANRTEAKAKALAEALGCAWGTNAQAAQAKYILLGVKPQMMAQAVASIVPALKQRSDRYILVSMAAGLTTEGIRAMTGLEDCPVIRIMPNTPAAIGKGVVLCCRNDRVTPEELAEFRDLFRCAGAVDEIDEHLMDAAAAVSGCGPAFVYMFIEALADGGVACGLPRDKAQRYAAQTLAGAAELLLTSGKHPGALKDAVCSPGGTTIEGVRTLEEGGFRSLAMDAVKAAYDKTLSLKG
ncbi:MAG: pyrroline-5-carboxylate reductase [Oscillospiraceae bacterium]|jgi:pyrroline-5-carboxylate reductase|nr:pyrroline-5-carboxylate reductase [Oscillospiraceae bacterium]MBQ8929743.1 pyrroline-5-carboxylate reductase [Oscillospiraceae bacterium]